MTLVTTPLFSLLNFLCHSYVNSELSVSLRTSLFYPKWQRLIFRDYSFSNPMHKPPIVGLTIMEENQFYLILIFISLWFSYCWWLSEEYNLNFGSYTTIVRLLFCIIHVYTVWKLFHYLTKLIFRLYYFSKRLQIALMDNLNTIILSFVLFLLLTFVLNLKQFCNK
jgi:hypothetical protein